MTRPVRPIVAAILLASVCAVNGACTAGVAPLPASTPLRAPAPLSMPNLSGSLKFAVLGDFGTGEPAQVEMARQMAAVYEQFPYELVLLVGDNLYGSERPQDFKRKFEDPYRPLLEAGVRFYGSLGNHDSREQRFYKLFNMEGNFYYSVKAPTQDARFFALDSTYPAPEQIEWIARELRDASERWKILFFHHPLYSSGGRHGSDLRLRETLEPIFLNENVSVVLNGHDHFYERVKPQQGIHYFVVGSGGKLRAGNIEDDSPITARGFDTDLTFLIAEIFEDEMHFNAVSRRGVVIDSGVIARQPETRTAPPVASPREAPDPR